MKVKRFTIRCACPCLTDGLNIIDARLLTRPYSAPRVASMNYDRPTPSDPSSAYRAATASRVGAGGSLTSAPAIHDALIARLTADLASATSAARVGEVGAHLKALEASRLASLGKRGTVNRAWVRVPGAGRISRLALACRWSELASAIDALANRRYAPIWVEIADLYDGLKVDALAYGVTMLSMVLSKCSSKASANRLQRDIKRVDLVIDSLASERERSAKLAANSELAALHGIVLTRVSTAKKAKQASDKARLSELAVVSREWVESRRADTGDDAVISAIGEGLPSLAYDRALCQLDRLSVAIACLRASGIMTLSASSELDRLVGLTSKLQRRARYLAGLAGTRCAMPALEGRDEPRAKVQGYAGTLINAAKRARGLVPLARVRTSRRGTSLVPAGELVGPAKILADFWASAERRLQAILSIAPLELEGLNASLHGAAMNSRIDARGTVDRPFTRARHEVIPQVARVNTSDV